MALIALITTPSSVFGEPSKPIETHAQHTDDPNIFARTTFNHNHTENNHNNNTVDTYNLTQQLIDELNTKCEDFTKLYFGDDIIDLLGTTCSCEHNEESTNETMILDITCQDECEYCNGRRTFLFGRPRMCGMFTMEATVTDITSESYETTYVKECIDYDDRSIGGIFFCYDYVDGDIGTIDMSVDGESCSGTEPIYTEDGATLKYVKFGCSNLGYRDMDLWESDSDSLIGRQYEAKYAYLSQKGDCSKSTQTTFAILMSFPTLIVTLSFLF